MSEPRHVKYLALAHDAKILAHHLHWDKDASSTENYESVLRTIFDSPGWAAVREQKKNKLELKSGANIYCIEIDREGRTYIAVITRAYPIRHIFSLSSTTSSTPKLMTEFATHVTATFARESVGSAPGGLKKSLRPFLRELATRFDDLDSVDKIAAVASRLSEVQDTLRKTIQKADERASLLEREDNKTREMEYTARSMFQRGRTLRRTACWAQWSSCGLALLIALLVAIGVGILLGLNYGAFHWWG